MEIKITGEAKEIAALVLEIQERQINVADGIIQQVSEHGKALEALGFRLPAQNKA